MTKRPQKLRGSHLFLGLAGDIIALKKGKILFNSEQVYETENRMVPGEIQSPGEHFKRPAFRPDKLRPVSRVDFAELERSALEFYRILALSLRLDFETGEFEGRIPAALLLRTYQYEACFRGFEAPGTALEPMPQASPIRQNARVESAYRYLFIHRQDGSTPAEDADIMRRFRELAGRDIRVRFAPRPLSSPHSADWLRISGRFEGLEESETL